MTVLVIGARPGSLGEAIKNRLDLHMMDVVTAGVAGEPRFLDVTQPRNIRRELLRANPDHVICTAGINLPDTQDPLGYKQMAVNYHGVMNVLHEYLELHSDGHFVAVSSNSAHIARSPSVGYCASKAALSMGIRAVARREARKPYAPTIYAWEFGLLEGTPMTQQGARQVPEGTPLTRMPGLPNGIPVPVAAHHVVGALVGGPELNGCTLRIDAGEQ